MVGVGCSGSLLLLLDVFLGILEHEKGPMIVVKEKWESNVATLGP